MNNRISPFNSSLEIGVRALTVLEAVYPDSMDLQRLVEYDYLVIHSGDAGGPESLHAPLPSREGELLVRRSIIESGLYLMMSRSLAMQVLTKNGIHFQATENTAAFLSSLSTSYITKLKKRANWVAEKFGNYSDEQLLDLSRRMFDKWTTQFHPIEKTNGDEK